MVNSKILVLDEPGSFYHFPANTTENEVLHVLLRKLYTSDSEEYLFDTPVGFWNNARIARIVYLMTTQNNLALITTNRDFEKTYLKISRIGVEISKKGGWLNHLNISSSYLI